MKPERQSMDFEKVELGEFLDGQIVDVEYDTKHTFKGYQGAEDKVKPAVRIVFELNGYEYPHRTRWLTFSYMEKSNLYSKYLVKLVEGATPDCDFDLDHLKGMKVKTYWAESKHGFQYIELIKPAEGLLKFTAEVVSHEEVDIGDSPEMEG